MAISADGKIATANRAVSSLGTEHDREHLLQLRAKADAVMAGARTVDLSRMTMGPGPARFRGLRLKRGLAEYNLRVIVSGQASISPDAEVFRRRFSPIILLTTAAAPPQKIEVLKSLCDEIKIFGRRILEFERALRWLAREQGVRTLLCEGGGELNAALFRAGLVDELHLTVCPCVIGGRLAPTVADGEGIRRLDEAANLELISRKRVGDELYLIYRTSGKP